MDAAPRYLERDRRWLLIRLHNAGYNDKTFYEYVRKYEEVKNDGEVFIPKPKLLAIVGRNFDDFFLTFLKVHHRTDDKVPLKPFLYFLKNGTLQKDIEAKIGNEKSESSFQTQNVTSTSIPLSGESNTTETTAVWKKHETVIQER